MIDCIEWTGTIGADGYGKKWNNKKRNWVQAHRWVYEQSVGPIPDGLMIRHLCHNKKCVNPDHLEPGTMKDNRQDDIDAGKDWFKGENNYFAKLTNNQTKEIQKLKPIGKPPYGYIRDIAKKYDIDRTHVYRIWSKE